MCHDRSFPAWRAARTGPIPTLKRRADVDAGAGPMPGALDFRAVVAFSPEEAFLMSAGPGEQSRIYHTSARDALAASVHN